MVIEEKTVVEMASDTKKLWGICGCVYYLERVSLLNLKNPAICVILCIVSILFDFIHTERKESVLNFTFIFIFSSYISSKFPRFFRR